MFITWSHHITMRNVKFVPDLEHKESIHFQETGCIQVAVVGNKCHYKNMVYFLFELGRAHVNAHDTLKEKCYGLLQVRPSYIYGSLKICFQIPGTYLI